MPFYFCCVALPAQRCPLTYPPPILQVLVSVSFLLCFSAMGYLLGMGETFTEALQFTVVLLVASIPIAIEIVCTTTLALGSRQLSEHGAIVTRLAAIEDMAGGWGMG